jgi:hypothetical protein
LDHSGTEQTFQIGLINDSFAILICNDGIYLDGVGGDSDHALIVRTLLVGSWSGSLRRRGRRQIWSLLRNDNA